MGRSLAECTLRINMAARRALRTDSPVFVSDVEQRAGGVYHVSVESHAPMDLGVLCGYLRGAQVYTKTGGTIGGVDVYFKPETIFRTRRDRLVPAWAVGAAWAVAFGHVVGPWVMVP